VKFLLALTNKKWPLGIDPGGHHFVVLNVSINSTPIFFSPVVIYKNVALVCSGAGFLPGAPLGRMRSHTKPARMPSAKTF
jgi:hypothetical protein